MQSSAAPHGIHWYSLERYQSDNLMAQSFRHIEKSYNQLLGAHPALTRNVLLNKLESTVIEFSSFITLIQQIAIFLRQLILSREAHVLALTERSDSISHTDYLPIPVCFDVNGVPWCPPLSNYGMGDPFTLSDRLNTWWGECMEQFCLKGSDSCTLLEADVSTTYLCDYLDVNYSHQNASTAMGTMVAIESLLSTDFWSRLRASSERICKTAGVTLPLPAFFNTCELHSRLQARHVFHLLELQWQQSAVDEAEMFRATKSCLLMLSEFEQQQAQKLMEALH